MTLDYVTSCNEGNPMQISRLGCDSAKKQVRRHLFEMHCEIRTLCGCISQAIWMDLAPQTPEGVTQMTTRFDELLNYRLQVKLKKPNLHYGVEYNVVTQVS